VSSPSVDRLNQVLAPHLGAARVHSVREEEIGTGQMSESRRLRVEYDGECALPTTLIAKFPSADPKSRATGKLTRCYEVESSFYRDLRDALDVGAPMCFHVERDEATDDFLLLLEDFAPCRQGDQIVGCTIDEARSCVDELVRLHGPLWNSSFLSKLAWLNRSTDKDRSASQALMQTVFAGFLQRYGDRLTVEARTVGEEFMRDSGGYFRRELPHRTVVHGDFRLDNMFFDDRGGVTLIDWQLAMRAPSTTDLVYFLGTNLPTDTRRLMTDELIDRYCEGLRSRGVPPEWSDRTRILKGLTEGVLFYCTSFAASILTLDQANERGAALMDSLVRRAFSAADDLDAGGLLGL